MLVPILAGTDCGVYLVIPGKSHHDELELLVKHFNISHLEALQSATINTTTYLGKPNEGTVRAGAKANLVILEKNPLEDVRNTRTIAFVVKNGIVYSEEDCTRSMEEEVKKVKEERAGHDADL